MDGSFDTLLNNSIFKDLDNLIIIKYFSSNFPHIFDKKNISFLYGSNQLSVRSYNVLSEMGVKYLSELKMEELDNISGLGEKSLNEIKKLIMEFRDI